MTREIKFRGKSKLNGEWWFGNLVVKDTIGRTQINNPERGGCFVIDPNTVGQFTGLHDKNGKEIYEGDIIQRVYEMEVGKGKDRYIAIVPVINDTPKVIDYREGAFRFVNFPTTEYYPEEWLPLLDQECEVIGNIHDNPELLKGGEA